MSNKIIMMPLTIKTNSDVLLLPKMRNKMEFKTALLGHKVAPFVNLMFWFRNRK